MVEVGIMEYIRVNCSEIEKYLEMGYKENANLLYNPESVHKWIADDVMKRYALKRMFPEYIAKAHLKGDIHLHDLEYAATRPVCLQHDLRPFFMYGLKVDGSGSHTNVSRPAKHPEVAIQHAAKVMMAAQTNMSGGQSIDEFNVWLAPYVRGLSYEEVKQLMQMFVYELNQMYVARGGQVIFSSVNCEFRIPEFLRDKDAIMGGKVVGTYEEYEDEARVILEALIDVMLEGDAMGKPFLFPNFIVKVRSKKDFDDELMYKLHELMVKYGTPYIINMIPEWQEINTNAMGCVDGKEVVIYRYEGNVYVESFERMWNRFVVFGVKRYGISEYIEVPNLEIYDSRNGFVKVKRIIRNPDKGDWVLLKLDNGRQIMATRDHPLPTKNGVKEIKDISVGEEIPVLWSYTFPETKKVDSDFAYIMGLLLRDGNREMTLSVGVDEEDIADEYIRIIEKVFEGSVYGEKVYVDRGEKGKYIEVVLRSNGDRGVRAKIIKKYNEYFG